MTPQPDTPDRTAFTGSRWRFANFIKAFTKQLEDNDDIFEGFPDLQHKAVQALIDLHDAMQDSASPSQLTKGQESPWRIRLKK